jgi:chemotaxis protein CheD
MSATGALPRAADLRPIHVVQGEYHVTGEPDVVLTTILGSCVAACLRDPVAGVGGMNHFLLPGGHAHTTDATSMRYGVNSMELLVNALLGLGARRDRLEAKLFGGARLMERLTDVGALNSDFAEEFLRREGLKNTGGSLRGDAGRRIQFWPISGRARQVFLGRDTAQALAPPPRVSAPAVVSGALELF